MWHGSTFSEHLGKDDVCDEMSRGVGVDDVADILAYFYMIVSLCVILCIVR